MAVKTPPNNKNNQTKSLRWSSANGVDTTTSLGEKDGSAEVKVRSSKLHRRKTIHRPPSHQARKMMNRLKEPSTRNVYDQYECRTGLVGAARRYNDVTKKGIVIPLHARLALRASSPDITEQELIRRSTFMLISELKVCACIAWMSMYYLLNEKAAAVMPFVYLCGVMSNFSFIAVWNLGTYETFVIGQLVLILIFPFMVHYCLGGLQESGGVMLWSFLSPLGAAFFRSSAESLLWFQVFLGLSVMVLGLEFLVVEQDNVFPTSSPVTVGFWTMNIVGVLSIVFSAAFFFAQALEAEYQRSEALLGNMLPTSVAKRIKQGENPILDKHEKVAILFADICGFTKAASTMDPSVLIERFLEDFFFGVDLCVEKRPSLTKIKTIGDAYMVAAGLEQDTLKEDNVTAHILGLASDMSKVLVDVNRRVGTRFEIRIGIHCGPVIAGVLGTQRIAYDVWGDAVNVASRMESGGRPGKVHLSHDAYQEVKNDNDWLFEECGEREIKGKGIMSTYLATPIMHESENTANSRTYF